MKKVMLLVLASLLLTGCPYVEGALVYKATLGPIAPLPPRPAPSPRPVEPTPGPFYKIGK